MICNMICCHASQYSFVSCNQFKWCLFLRGKSASKLRLTYMDLTCTWHRVCLLRCASQRMPTHSHIRKHHWSRIYTCSLSYIFTCLVHSARATLYITLIHFIRYSIFYTHPLLHLIPCVGSQVTVSQPEHHPVRQLASQPVSQTARQPMHWIFDSTISVEPQLFFSSQPMETHPL